MPTLVGQLDQLLTFEAPQDCEDGFGGGRRDWGLQARAWASVKPVSAREGERQGAERASTVYMIECWQDGLSAVTEASRIVWGAVTMNIREIRRPPSRTMMLTIIAETGVTL
jgi:head-tail adaptor